MYIDVLIELKNKQTDQMYTYEVPVELKDKIAVGKRVKVTFNKRPLEGFILRIKKEVPEEVKILPIKEVVDEEIVLNEELMKIGEFIKQECLCSLSSAYGAMLPKALKASDKTNINKKYETYLELNKSYNEAISLCTSDKQKEVIDYIEANEPAYKKEANKISTSSVLTLIKKNVIREVQEE